MSGISDLATLLAHLEPNLSPTEVVFCSFPGARLADKLFLNPIAVFAEPEGLSLIIDRTTAEAHAIPFTITLRRITLTVHSSLQAIGLTAAVADRLAHHGISANVVAAYHHDHVLVPTADAERALEILRDLQRDHSSASPYP